jgi:hypothetical protein
MSRAFLRLSFRKLIDAETSGAFEKNVLHYSYQEFKLKSQVYNPDGKFRTFSEMKANDGRANSLHYKSGFAISGFIEKLDHCVPGLVDNAGYSVLFDTCRFELIESDITDPGFHKLTLIFTTEVLLLHEVIGEYLLLSLASQAPTEGELNHTFVIRLQPGLSVSAYGTTADIGKLAKKDIPSKN